LITNVPLTTSHLISPIWIEGLPAPPAGEEPQIDVDSIGPGYLEAMGTPLLRGRSILATDRSETPGVAVVSRAMAERFWPGADPIGRRISFESAHGPWVTVVGVARDVRRSGLERAAAPQVYVPFDQQPRFFMTFVVRTAGDPMAVVPAMRRAVLTADPNQAVAWVRPLTEVVSASIDKPRFVAMLLSLFAAIALALAAVGMYGVMAHSVSQRRREIAVRLALGARRADVMRLVLGNAMALTLAGLALGLGSAITLGRVLSGFVFGVSATDPWTLAAISLLVAGTAMASTYLPARRAARVTPSSALKLG
jgi:putative ABC transport system permease protein